MIDLVKSLWAVASLAGLLTLASCAVAHAQGGADVRISSIPEDTTIDGAELDIPFDIRGNKIVVDATINGQGPYPLIVDTGASLTVLDRALADELGLEAVGTTEVGDSSSSAERVADLVLIRELSIGGMTASGVQATSWDRSDLYRGMANRPRGIIGFPFFSEYLLTVDYTASSLNVTRGSASTRRYWSMSKP